LIYFKDTFVWIGELHQHKTKAIQMNVWRGGGGLRVDISQERRRSRLREIQALKAQTERCRPSVRP
jgi:hypothetical protein